MIDELWRTGQYITHLDTLETKPTVGVHRALVKWSDGETRDSHLKIVFQHGHLPHRHIIHEVIGWLIADALGLPVPARAGVMVLSGKQIETAHPSRARSESSLAWVTSTEPQTAIRLTPGMDKDAHLDKEIQEWSQLAAACAFDEWLANTDRYPRNLLRRGEKDFVLIDHDNIANSAHWLADWLAGACLDEFTNVLRDRYCPSSKKVACPERAFSNDMLGHSERYSNTISDLADSILQWLQWLVDDEPDRWALAVFITERARHIEHLIRKRYRLLM